MAVLHLAKPAESIDNNRTSVGLPPTGPSVAPNYRLEFGYDLVGPTATADIVTLFDNRLTNRFFNQLFIDGGTA